MAFVSGEPGIGKTRLATLLAIEAHGAGASVLYGRCDEELGVPYGPWVEALGHYAATAPEEILRAHAERQGGELARLVPEVSARLDSYPAPRETEPETERYLLFGAVAGLLEEATRDTPLVLILDDLHWADKPSLALLRHLVTHGGEMRVLVLGTYRDSELHARASADRPARRPSSRARRRADRSDGAVGADVVAIMEAAAGHALDEAGRGSRRRSSARPTATRSSSPSCCATWSSRARWSRAPMPASAWRARSMISACPRASARWWDGGSSGSSDRAAARSTSPR